MRDAWQWFSQDELLALKSGCFVFDLESFVNYFLVAFKHTESGKLVLFEWHDDEVINGYWLQWMFDNFCIVGFNINQFDLPIVSMAICGKYTPAEIKNAVNDIILGRVRPLELAREYGFLMVRGNTVDLIEVAPLSGSLKVYGARMHCKHLQDLPYDPEEHLSREQCAKVRSYCVDTDLQITDSLARELTPQLNLRASMSAKFKRDLRSLSDAQLAQEIIETEIARVTGKRPRKVDFQKYVGTVFCYHAPDYVCFAADEYNAILREITSAEIEIGPSGHVICPKSIEGRCFIIGERKFAIGMGGLHSQEKSQTVTADGVLIVDCDVASYYPSLILKNKFAPEALGEPFLEAFQNIVDTRLAAKKAKDTVTADSLKIATNGSFGKTSDPYSSLYGPKMTVATTLTGQLSLLMLIEMLTINAFSVISANTDGIVTLVPPDRYGRFVEIVKAWEAHTKLETEETRYAGLYSRDVNNYIAVKTDGKVKTKGVYAEVGSALNSRLSKNPDANICNDAVVAHITDGTPVSETIRGCSDITRFLVVKKVTGGAQKDGRYLGKVVRWYYATGVIGGIIYCKSGNRVAGSEGGKPCMTLPDVFPADVNFALYEEMATGILEDIGFQKKRNSQLTLI